MYYYLNEGILLYRIYYYLKGYCHYQEYLIVHSDQGWQTVWQGVVGYLDATSTTIRSVKANEGLIGDVDYCEEVLYIPIP